LLSLHVSDIQISGNAKLAFKSAEGSLVN